MNNPNKYHQHFNSEYSRLNTHQKEAVDQIEGPVLVIAGPGTGKTQILSARIGKILSTLDLQVTPSNILCLTFTDAAVLAMRKRLFQFIGPEAYKVPIHTFHSFCNQIIQDNPQSFGGKTFNLTTELENFELLEELINHFGPDHPLKRYTGEIYYDSKNLKDLFHLMKTENWDFPFIKTKVTEYLAEIPGRDEFRYQRNYKEFKKGDVKPDKIRVEEEKMKKLLGGAIEFDNYKQRMLEKNLYDYDDMIGWVLSAFRNNENLLRQYQEQFWYILVDEYQDTNGSQNELLYRLSDYWESPNLFVVGDDDQSIYRFQGANVANLLDYSSKYSATLRTVMLDINYRSSRNILDNAQGLIQMNKERLVNKIKGLTKSLKPGSVDFAESPVKPYIVECYNSIQEEIFIAEKIMELKNANIPLSEIAVIYRNHHQAERIVKYLSLNGIPLNLKRKYNILEHTFIVKILTILNYITLEDRKPFSGEHLLFEIMHYDFFDIHPSDIAIITHHKNTNGIPIREIIGNPKILLGLNLKTLKNISLLEQDLNFWIVEHYNLTLQMLIEKMITRGGILAYIMKSPDKFWLLQCLQTFFDFVKEYSSRIPKLNSTKLVELLDKMKDYKIPLEILQLGYNEDGVHFLTAHSSKGLEFRYVFLMGCTEKIWNKKKSNRGFSFPDNMITGIELHDSTEEERRLFFVALTRAKEHLTMSYPSHSDEGDEVERSRFIAEILDEHEQKINFINYTTPKDVLENFQVKLLLHTLEPNLKNIETNFIRKLLEDFRMNVTALNNYLRCPVYFYFQNLIRVPQAKNENTGFGIAIHFALQQYFILMKSSKNNEFPKTTVLIRLFEQAMDKNKDSFNDEQYQRRLEYGRKILPLYYERYHTEWNTIILPEMGMKQVYLDDIPLSGILDKVEFTGKQVNVVDYKTGKPENGIKKLKPPDEKDPNGGDYWRQLVFYKILLDNYPAKDWTMVSGEIDFIEPNKHGEFLKEKRIIQMEEVEIVKKQIREVYTKIMNLEFTKGCGEDDCKWCKFLKVFGFDRPHFDEGEEVGEESE